LSCPGMQNGYNNNPNSVYRYSRLGCINTNISEADCTYPNVWVDKATTASECAAHGESCQSYNIPPNEYSESECQKCNSTYSDTYQWQTGNWRVGTVEPLVWTTRNWTSVNQWTLTLDWQKLNDVMNTVGNRIMTRQIANAFANDYGSLMPVYLFMACDCLGESAYCSLSGETLTVFDSSCVADPTSGGTCGNSGQVGFDAGGETTTTITVNLALAGSLTGGESGNVTKRQSKPIFSVVTDAAGNTVGQIVGRGVQVVTDKQGDYRLCLDRSLEIEIEDGNFTLPDFISVNVSGSGKPILGHPLNYSVEVQGKQYCYTLQIEKNDTTKYHVPILKTKNAADIHHASTSSGQLSSTTATVGQATTKSASTTQSASSTTKSAGTTTQSASSTTRSASSTTQSASGTTQSGASSTTNAPATSGSSSTTTGSVGTSGNGATGSTAAVSTTGATAFGTTSISSTESVTTSVGITGAGSSTGAVTTGAVVGSTGGNVHVSAAPQTFPALLALFLLVLVAYAFI